MYTLLAIKCYILARISTACTTHSLALSAMLPVQKMAEAQFSLDSFKKQLDDQLTCNVCLDQYTNPKTLPCLHSFCLECIQPLPVVIKVNQNPLEST